MVFELVFVLTFENTFSQRFHFKANRKSIDSSKKGTRDFQNSPPFERSACFYVTISESFKRFQYRSSHQRCSIKIGALKNFTKFTGKRLCQGLFFNKVAGQSPATLLKKRLWHRCFPVKFAKFLRTPFLQNTYRDCFCIFLRYFATLL